MTQMMLIIQILIHVNQAKGMNTQTDLSTFKEESMQRNPSGIDEESANTVVPILLHTLVKRY